MKRLFLLRHAKAGSGASDHDRPLATRGIRDSVWLGQFLQQNDLLPDHILCSSSRRTCETNDQLQYGAQSDISVTFQDGLYLASASYILSQIRNMEPQINSLMVIGHNPGIAQIFQQLTLNPPGDYRTLKYPTAMVTIIDFSSNRWDRIQHNTGQLHASIIPSDRQKQQNKTERK